LKIDNDAVRESQILRLQNLKKTRDTKKVIATLKALTQAAESGKENLLALTIEAAKNRATLGEISDALELIFGRHLATHKTISGVYKKNIKDDKLFKKAQELADKFADLEGRRPRIMIAKMGQDGHDRGAKVVATGFADLGFDVDIGALFQAPKETAKQAVENDVHILGVSSLAAGHKTLIPQVIAELKKYHREDILVIAGGVIPVQDYQFLFDNGVVGIFGPGTQLAKAAIEILEVLIENVRD
jgi:methylmalonyl-CoA mutase